MSQTVQRTFASNQIFKAVRDHEGFKTPGHKFLMLVLASHGNSDGTNISPGRKILAKNMGCTIRTIEKKLHDLEKDQFILTNSKKGGRGHTTNYRANLVKLGLIDSPSPPQEEVNPPAPPAQNGIAPTVAPIPESTEMTFREYRQKLKEMQNVPTTATHDPTRN